MKTIRVKPKRAGRASALLVHGNDLCGEFYLPLAERLAERGLEIHLPTLAGFHQEPPYDDPTWSTYATDISTALAALDGERRVLIGHSMGGFMAFLAAAQLGNDLDRLVLIEPAIYPRRFMARAACRAYLRHVVTGDRSQFENSTGIVPRIHQPHRYPEEMIALYLEVRRTSHVPTMVALFEGLADSYPLPFDAITAPTLLVSGANIGVRGRFVAGMVRRRLSLVTHRTVPNAAHWIVNEQDEALCHLIAEFVA